MTDGPPARAGYWIGGLVVFGVAVVGWAVTHPTTGGAPDGSVGARREAGVSDVSDERDPLEDDEDDEDAGAVAFAFPPPPADAVNAPLEADCELAVVTDWDEAKLAEVMKPKAIAASLTAAECGKDAECADVRGLITERRRFSAEIVPVENWILPPKDNADVVAPGLSATAIDRVYGMPRVIVVRARAPVDRRQLPVRAGFAAASALAKRVNGFVYDESLRRIESADAFEKHAVTETFAEGAFRADRFVVQSYDDGPDGGPASIRILTLGLQRFGAPDLIIENASAKAEKASGAIIYGVGEALSKGARTKTLLLSKEVLAIGFGAAASDLKATAEVVLFDGERAAGDADNVLVRIRPSSAAPPGPIGKADAKGGAAPTRGDAQKAIDDLVTKVFPTK